MDHEIPRSGRYKTVRSLSLPLHYDQHTQNCFWWNYRCYVVLQLSIKLAAVLAHLILTPSEVWHLAS
jgi:hypothetical protein